MSKEQKISALELKNQLDACLPLIEKSLDEQTKQITVEDIPAVAKIAGESEALGEVLGEIYRIIGKDGIIHLENSGTYTTDYTLIEGVRFQGTGYLSPVMANEGKKAIYHKPAILVTKRKINHLNDINPLLGALIAKEVKDLVIFTDDMDSDVARMLIELQKNPKRSINILIIKAPTLWKPYVFEDFAKITSSSIVEDSTGITFKNLQLDHLGTCGTIIVDKEETVVIGIVDISDHIEELKKGGTTDDKLRLSWLSTKTAILKLGSKSETELTYLRLKAEDAIWSSRTALAHGVVAGGGVALLNASRTLPDTIGGSILTTALKAPILQIQRNASYGLEATDTLAGGEFGFDAKQGKIVHMFEAGIVDSALIVKNAIRNALGIASTLLTISSAITLPEEKPLPINPFPF